jgi:diguanylate cyclase (GGDEF)-like protein
VLAEFAQIFNDSVEMGVCGRWGGDEFVAILPERSDAAMKQIFECIEARALAWSQSNGLPMGVSLGISHAPQDGHDLMTLLSVADIHLYQNKSQMPNEAKAQSFYRNLVDEPETS